MVQRGWAAHVLGRAEHSFTECVHAHAHSCVATHAARCKATLTHAHALLHRSPVTAVTELRKARARHLTRVQACMSMQC